MGRISLAGWGIVIAGLLVACGGGGDSAPASPPTTPPPVANTDPDPPAMVTVSGKITFARVPFRPTPASGLDYVAQTQEPARFISYEVRNASTQAVLASGVTDANGDYSASVPSGTSIFVRAIAQMMRTTGPLPHWNVSVRDLDTDGPVYTHDGAAASSGGGSSILNMAIPSGWSATGLPNGTRAAAPFAILDTIYQAVSLVLTAAPEADFPVLAIDWSPQNQGAQTFYSNDAGGDDRHIVLSGEADVDTDEYDTYVIAHEFGHYIEDRFSRSDSIGGTHSFGERLDPRLAFGEGFGNAFAGMVTGSPLLRDSAGMGQLDEGRFNLESDGSDDGWFSERTCQEILWDLFDAADDGVDAISTGFPPIWQVLTGAERTTPALTSIFPFIAALKQQLAASVSQIDQVVAAEGIDAVALEPFATTETHFPGPAVQAEVLPLYTDIAIAGPSQTVSSSGIFGTENKLSNHRFLRLVVPAPRSVHVSVTAPPPRDADVTILRGGEVLRFPQENGPADEDFTIELSAGTYVLDVYDCGNAACGPDQAAATDITVSVN